jgi:hypothetical protein
MLGCRDCRQPTEPMVVGPLRDLVPDDHVLVRVHRVLDLSWLPAEVADRSSPGAGRPSIDPEVTVQLMLAGLSGDHLALLRAHRRRERWSEADRRFYERPRWCVEGVHGEAKTWHRLSRAVWRGLVNMRV